MILLERDPSGSRNFLLISRNRIFQKPSNFANNVFVVSLLIRLASLGVAPRGKIASNRILHLGKRAWNFPRMAPTPAAMEYQSSLEIAAAVTNDENGVLLAVGRLTNTGARPVLQVTLEIHVAGPDGKSLTWSQGPVVRTVTKVTGGWLFKTTSVRYNKNAWSAKDGPLLPRESVEVRKKFPLNAAPGTAYTCRMTVMDVEFGPAKGQ